MRPGGTDGNPVEIGYFLQIEAPVIDMDKKEIVKIGKKVNAPMELSYSCYMGKKEHCGVCESCMRRKEHSKCLELWIKQFINPNFKYI